MLDTCIEVSHNILHVYITLAEVRLSEYIYATISEVHTIRAE